MVMETGVVLLLIIALVAKVEGQVNTSSGEVVGIPRPELGLTEYLGIPYAEAPEGDLRFKPPVKKARMEGIFSANSSAKICPQPYATQGVVQTVQTEDCLRLNIYKPTAASADNPLPVMVWVHGGGYITGDSSLYYGGFMAAWGQVIVVTLNYRLSILGFLNTMDNNAVGNFGLRDQCLAIDWVYENIGAFGGNASQVTIFGESAGASSVLQLTMSNLCADKFQRVIAQSGTPSAHWAYNENPRIAAQKLATESGCPSDSRGLITCLRNKTVEEINNFQKTLNDEGYWAPHYSTDIFPDNPLDILAGKNSPGLRRFRSKDLLTGLCNEEGEFGFRMEISNSGGNLTTNPTINVSSGVLTDEEFEQHLNKSSKMIFGMDGYELNKLFPAIRFQYTEWKTSNDQFSNAKSIIKFHSDADFNFVSIQTANVHSDNKQNSMGRSFFYQFIPRPSWIPTYPWSDGSTHADELVFVFNGVSFFGGTEKETELAYEMNLYWTNFAKSGSPNVPAPVNVTWPEYNRLTGEYIKLDFQSSRDQFPFAKRFAFWENLFKPTLARVRQDRKEMEEKCKNDNNNNGNDDGINKGVNFNQSMGFLIITFILSHL